MYQGYISAEKIWFARHEGKYEGAEGLEAFSSALEANVNDVPSQLYIERCNLFKDTPPPQGWNGEWVMTEK